MQADTWIRSDSRRSARAVVLALAAGISWFTGSEVLRLVSPARAGEAASAKIQQKRVLKVGPGESFTVPSAAARAALDGDTIEIRAGTYEKDSAVWTHNNLTIRGVGGRPHIQAGGVSAEGKAIWVIRGKNVIVENIEFSGATVPDGNGAGIRGEGSDLTIRQCYFHDNQAGFLCGKTDGSIVIESSEFANNGTGDGQTHNIYVGATKSFTLRNSYSHHAKVGHNLKSRALENHVLYNRLMDETSGTASYEIELPLGGVAYVIGNVIQKGPDAENSVLFSYGAEGLEYQANRLYVVNNTFVNNRPDGGVFLYLKQPPKVVKIVNNLFSGNGEVLRGSADLAHNQWGKDFRFADARKFDYHLMDGSPAIDAGIDPGSGEGSPLAPVQEPLAGAQTTPRRVVKAIDLGAFEFAGRR